jgi:hypothetical protein
VEFAEGRILAYDKAQRTSRMRHLDYGLGALDAATLDGVAHGAGDDLAALYQALLSQDALAGWEVDQPFYEIGSLEGLARTRRYLAASAAHASHTGAP